MNQWQIPLEIERIVSARDKKCVYCHCVFSKKLRKTTASWEHIINDAKITTLENIAKCCVSCNASKSAKTLSEWFNSKYCIEKNINQETVSEIVKQHIQKYWTP